MPELPEVETVAAQLAPLITGRVVRRLTIFDPRLAPGATPRLAGRAVARVYRSGKRVLIEFQPARPGGEPLWLAVHLRMTGRLVWAPGVARKRPHQRARLALAGGAVLFLDARRFGTFDWYSSAEAAAPAGFDPVAGDLTAHRLEDLLRDSRQELKAWLLRQDRLVGVGNIYACEILNEARLAPRREAGSLPRREVTRLHAAIGLVLQQAIAACGTTFSDFQDARGLEGAYQLKLRVYDREGEPCRRCKAPIERIVQQQRSTFFCPKCQR